MAPPFDRLRGLSARIVERLRDERIRARSATLAYSLLLAIIPLLFVFIQIGALLLRHPESFLGRLAVHLPEAATAIILRMLELIAAQASGTAMSLGVLTALWLGSNGVDSLILSINDSLGFRFQGKAILRRAIALVYTAALIALLLIALLLYVFYDQILDLISRLLRLDNFVLTLWRMMGSLTARLLPAALFFLILTIFYKSAPLISSERLSWREAAVGGGFATLGILLTTSVYAFLMNAFSGWSLYFGSLAGIIALLIWLNYVCLILVVSAEIIGAFRDTCRPEFPAL